MSPTLLLGNEALAWGAVHGGADFFAAYPLPIAAELDRVLSGALAEQGEVVRTGEASGAAAALVEAAERGRLGVTVLDREGLLAAAPALARAAERGLPALLVVIGAPGDDAFESARQAELAALRAAAPGSPVYAPASAAECYLVARAAALGSRRSRVPALVYADALVARLREPAEIGPGSGAPPREEGAPAADLYRTRDATLLVVAVGIVARAARTAVRVARERGIRAGLFRPLRLWPPAEEELAEAAARARRVLVVELNEGQLWEPVAARLHALESRPVIERLAEAGGGRLTPERILAAIVGTGGDGGYGGDEGRGRVRADGGLVPVPRRGLALRLAGEPAHGLLFTGYVLAEAALLERRAVAHLPTLGAAARGPLGGGAIRIGAEPGEDPFVDAADCLLLTSREALERFGGALMPSGVLLVEESLPERPGEAIPLPLVETAVEAGGTPLVVDLVAAAVITELTGAVSRRALEEAAARLLPDRGRPAGLAALEAGLELAKRRPHTGRTT